MRFCFFILTFFSLASAFNHPEIEWKSVSTEHFRINFYDATEPVVYATWKIAEETYQALIQYYGYVLKDRINITLADYDDYSNGMAGWTEANIVIWVPDSRFDLRSSTTWLRNVITHEMAHIISLESKKKLFGISADFRLETPDERITAGTYFGSISLYPAWLTEGIAQIETEQMGHDCWDSRREMVLRCAALEGKLLTLEEMGHFNHDALGSEMVYNQGFSFCKHIQMKTGAEALRTIFKIGSSMKTNLNSLFSSRTGYSLNQLYREWADSLKMFYSDQVDYVSPEVKTIWNRGRYNLLPQVSPDGKIWGWLTSDKDDDSRTDLLFGSFDQATKLKRIPYAHSSFCFSSDSKEIFYIKSRSPNRNGSFYNDIYSYNLDSGREKRLTKDARVYSVSASPDGKGIACVRYSNSVFSLDMFDLSSGEFRNISPGISGEPFMHLSFNPSDPLMLAVSKIVNGKSRIFRMNLGNSEFSAVTPGTAQEEAPHWAEDGRIYFSADFDGTFQIYSVLPDGTDLLCHSKSTGGAFSPFGTPDKQIIFSSYSASGFSIAKLKPDAVPVDSVSGSGCSFQPLPAPKGKVVIDASPYHPYKLRPQREMRIAGQVYKTSSLMTGQYRSEPDITEFLFGGFISKVQSDALEKSTRWSSAGMGVFGRLYNDREGIQYNSFSIPEKEIVQKNRFHELKSRITEPVKERVRRYSGMRNDVNYLEATSAEDEESGSVRSGAVPVIFTDVGWENRATSATLGLELGAQMQMFMPAFINAAGYLKWQLARDLEAGIAPECVVNVPAGLLAGSIPVVVEWKRSGYVNEDMQYNGRDITQLSIIGGPDFRPSYYIHPEGDTVVTVPNGLVAGINFYHGFPLGRYGSLQLSNYEMVNYANREVLDWNGILDDQSKTYYSSKTGISIVLPLARDINKGSVYYFDAMYGSFGYDFQIYTNGQFFDSLSVFTREILKDPSYTPSAAVGHFISFSLELGHIKSYTFNQRFSAGFSYEFLRKRYYFSLGAGL